MSKKSLLINSKESRNAPGLVTIIDRTALRYGYQGSTRRLAQLATAWSKIGHEAMLVRSDLRFASADGPLARANFPGTVTDVPSSVPLQFLHSSSVMRPITQRAKKFLSLPQYHWKPSMLDRDVRDRVGASSGMIWAVCKGSIENLKFAEMLSRETGRPWVVSLHDPPTGLVLQGELQESVRQNIAPLFGSAAHICTTSVTLRELLIDQMRISPDRITNIPLRAEPRLSTTAIQASETNFLGGPRGEGLTLVYAGQLHGDSRPGLRSLRPLLDAIRLVQSLRQDVRVSVVSMGMGAGHEEAARHAAGLGLDDAFVQLASQEQSTAAKLEAIADAVILLQGEAQRHQMPSKVLDLLAGDRPILALVPEGSEVERVLRSSGKALIARPRDVATVAQHIMTLAAGAFAPAAPATDHDSLMDGYRLESLPTQLLEVMEQAGAWAT